MDKDLIIEILISRISKELETSKRIVADTKDFVTQDDMQQEGKYDTRRIEASYLAGAQDKRVQQLEMDLNILKGYQFVDQSDFDEIATGALINSELEGVKRTYFLSPASGGNVIEIENKKIHVVSVNSPIGGELLKLEVGDIVALETPTGEKELEILDFS